MKQEYDTLKRNIQKQNELLDMKNRTAQTENFGR